MRSEDNPRDDIRQDEDAALRRLLRRVPAVVWTTGPNLRIREVHGAALDRFGLDPGKATGRTIAEYLEADEADFAPLSASRRALKGEEVSAVISWRGRMLHVVVEPLRGDDGKIAGTLGMAVHTPDSQELRDALLMSQARIAGIVNISEDAIISLDRSQCITLFNRGAEKMFGYTAEEVLGKSIDMLLPERFVASHHEHISRFGRSGDALRPMNDRGAIFGKRKDGSEFPAEASISKFEVAGEPILNVRMRDITDRVRAEEEMKARARQQAALARLGHLALRGGEIRGLMKEACRSVAATLGVHLCTVFERLPGSDSFLLTAGEGWPEDALRTRTLPGGTESQAGHTLRAGSPVVITDLGQESRFSDACLAEQGVVSGISVIIDAPEGPFGVLGAHSREKRDFSEHDLNYLQAVANVLGTAIGRKRTEDALRESTETIRVVNQAAPVSIWMLDLEGNVTFWNPAAERTFGWTEREVIGKPLPLILDNETDDFATLLKRFRAGEKLAGFEARRKRKNGSALEVSLWSTPLRDGMGGLHGTLVVAVDITERKRLEEQLRQSQKLESIGLLAGGIAHDFNNLLTGIMGNISLALDMLSRPEPAAGMLENALSASERAAELIRQLLAYSGKGRFVVQPVDLSAEVRELVTLLQTSIPKMVRLKLELDDNLPAIDSDPGQVQQLVMNLVINGAEAIGDAAGTVTVRTRQVDAPGPDLAPGRYVQLEVSDTGSGMDDSTVAQIFEPFFTTKFTGRGLGLAAVSGIVRAHKGAIRVHSVPGGGSTFTITLPASETAPASTAKARPAPNGRAVLVVDDEDMVRRTAKAALERQGYRVLLADNGREAVETYRAHRREIAVVLLDMSMPVMSGEEALKRLLEIEPNVRVIVSSGYNEVEAIRRFTRRGVAAFIQKPYTASQLAREVERVLTAA